MIKQGIQTIIDWLEKRRDETNKEILQAIEDNPELKGKAKLLESTPGVGPTTTATLFTELSELDALNRLRLPLW